MSRKPIKRFLPLTYAPKIQGVLDGSITQSIRIDTDLKVGDFIAFHGWQGRPYRSPWSFRTPYMQLIMAMPIHFKKDNTVMVRSGIGTLWSRPDLVDLAERDGIYPATAEELIGVIRSMHGNGDLKGKVLRWQPPQTVKRIRLSTPGQCFVQLGAFDKEKISRDIPASHQ